MLFHRFFAKADYPELAATIQQLLEQLEVTDCQLLEVQPATYRQPYRRTLTGQFRGSPFILSLERSALGVTPAVEQLDVSLACTNPEWQRWVLAPPAAFKREAKRRLDIHAQDLSLPIVLGANAATPIAALTALVKPYAALWQLLGESTVVLERERLCAHLPWLPHQHHQQTALLRLLEWLDQLRSVAARSLNIAEG